MKTSAIKFGLCLALGLMARAQDANTDTPTTPPTTPPEHKGSGGHGRHGHGQGQGQGLGQGQGQGQGECKGPNSEEAKKFRESLKNMPEDQRKAAIQKRMAEMGGKFKADGAQRLAKIKEHIEQNKNLTDAQKKEILGHIQGQFEKAKAEREKIMSDTTLDPGKKRAAMQKLHESLDAERKAMREKYRNAFGPPPGHQPGGAPPSV